MKIPEFTKPELQMAQLDNYHWAVSRLIELSRGFPIMDIPINYLRVYYQYEELTLRQMVMHMRAVNDADLSFPIILDEDGRLLDGRHRIMKAMLTGAETIKAVRFDENPIPCKIDAE